MVKNSKIVLYWSLLVIYAISMLSLSAIASFDFIPQEYLVWKKYVEGLGHFCLSGGLALLILFGLNLKKGPIKKWGRDSYWTAFLYAFFCGIVIESLQTFVPMRATSLHDVGINTLGIIFVLLATYAYSCKKHL